MKRKTTKHRRHSRQSVLEVRVMSPRIAWFGFLRFAGKIVKIACLLAVLAAIGWGVWRGIQHAFYKNPDFRLQVIDLNPNPVIDELGVAKVAGIDLTASPACSTSTSSEATRKLGALPGDHRRPRRAPPARHPGRPRRRPHAESLDFAARTPDLAEVRQRRRHAGGLAGRRLSLPRTPNRNSPPSLPVIELPASADASDPTPARKSDQPELEHCFALLDSAREADPEAPHWIESIRQVNDWSLLLVTRDGTAATFGLGDHARQIESLRAALDHAGEKGYVIETINLIPKYNIPDHRRGGGAPPRAIPVSEPALPPIPPKPAAPAISTDLLNRN